MRYCFLSHSGADKPFVRRLASDLQAQGCRVWVDEAEIRPGESITARVGDGISHCDTVLLIWSENAARSPWVEEEFSASFLRRVQSRATIIPLRLDETPLPALIQHIKYADFRTGYDVGLRSVLVALGTAAGDPPLLRGERRLLRQMGREGRVTDMVNSWEVSMDTETRESIDSRRAALRHLVRLHLATATARPIYSSIDGFLQEDTYMLTDKGRLLCSGLAESED